MKRWLLAGAMAFATAGQGLASDLPPPAAPPSPRAPAAYFPPVAAIYNWGGVYFGFNLGFGFGTSSWNDPRNFSGLTVDRQFQSDWLFDRPDNWGQFPDRLLCFRRRG